MGKETFEVNSSEEVLNPTMSDKLRGIFGVRHLQVVLSFLLIFISYGVRVNLSVGIVAMTDNTTSANPEIPTYPEWNDKSIMLSAFFWGYFMPQIAAGELAKKYGTKWLLVLVMGVCSLFGMIIPLSASVLGSKGVMGCRAVQGFAQGFIIPSTHCLLSRWVPLRERSRMGTFVYAGGPLGTVVSMIITGLISASWQGWPFVFYLYSVVGLLWCVLMATFGSDSPSEHSSITEEEKKYIESGLDSDKEELATPWKDIFTSLPFWGLLVAHCGANWGFWTLMTEIPTYMSKMLNFDIKSNSYLSALPYLVLWVLSFAFSGLADLIIIRNWASVGATRKIFNTIGYLIPTAALIPLGFVTQEDRNIAVGLLVTAVGISSAMYSGFVVNHIDLSPNHSATLMGITNCLANVCSLLAPILVQVIVTDETDLIQWRMIFLIAAAIYIASNSIFVLFGSGEVQPWNDKIKPSKPKADMESGNKASCETNETSN